MDFITIAPEHGDIAQLVERLLCKQDVAGSIPVISTKGKVSFIRYGGRLLDFRKFHGPYPDFELTGRPLSFGVEEVQDCTEQHASLKGPG